MENIQHSLLNSDDETILKVLESLNLSENEGLKDVLVILWQVHPDETIKDKALGHLVNISDEQERGFIEEIFSVFKSIIEQLPWMGEYRELQASNFAKFLQGKDQYEVLLTTSSVFVDYYLDLGRKLYMMFDLVDEAQICFEGIVAHNDKNDEAFYALGRLNERKLKMDKALELYEKCIALNDSHIYGLLQLGILKAGQFKDYEGAIVHYNKVLEIEPFMAETNVRVAEAHYALGDVKRAKQFIDIALDINEFHDEALNLLGQIQWHHEEDIEAALETFQKGVDHKVHGDSALLLASLGELHAAHLGEYDKARVFYEKSLKEKPNQAETLRKLMVILENINQDYGAMSTCYENYFMIEKNDASMYVDYANFLIKYMHDYEFAKIQLDAALEIDETNEDALKVKRQIGDYIDDEDEDEDDDVNDDDDDNGGDDDDDDDFSGGGAAGDN